ncbi:molybdate ABC transporter substrate-binding protein [Shewanella fidelis]|uniref:Molybdate ABC transporter substrate-binding protein n=1 Tax=Shewanella fidelis TaxID=173509 RepID=A0AAW8NT35_9GAMM|nr:molybdate ABC transporter substrate-binding protein [Shewanella fidelis]MDR8525726.1 molybdate ABC transporter substrate-binding protein [Shewanella fidelis]MDW4812765.1 molybdate ABC transporter substrate-binding protein [Shewanella fidelis]MDW4816513.1 molybdate ABC transporter substrate-binding protein [Shewanella fidelis]MDW4820323.1 molybdate ABC transporter substrate-binding protein [Shewanella fidelis]MDW4825229.1 molybdate ABC transporter substrate-binding protein [Shewanella fideli
MKFRAMVLALALPLLLCSKVLFAAQDVPAIAAASSIKFALDDIAKQFTQETGRKVRISYGSSGNFVAQIRNGAPFELFLSADERYTQQLSQANETPDDGVIYAVGQLAIAAPKSSPLPLDGELNGVKQLLASGQLKRFAIANPEHAPYGERAKEVLQKVGLWQDIQANLVFGENVSQAAQFAVSGATQGGLVALSLAVAKPFKARANYVLIPQEYYTPLDQRMVLTLKAGETAKLFYSYLQSDAAQTVFADYGFARATH